MASPSLKVNRRAEGIADAGETASGSASESAREVAELLGQFERTLVELSSACYALAPMVIPRSNSGGPGLRFDRADRPDSRPLSRESEALCLSTLHDLGAAIGRSAQLCRSARGTLISVADRCVPAGEP
jgi:hypothetical protein